MCFLSHSSEPGRDLMAQEPQLLFEPCVYRFHRHALNWFGHSGLTVQSALARIDSASA